MAQANRRCEDSRITHICRDAYKPISAYRLPSPKASSWSVSSSIAAPVDMTNLARSILTCTSSAKLCINRKPEGAHCECSWWRAQQWVRAGRRRQREGRGDVGGPRWGAVPGGAVAQPLRRLRGRLWLWRWRGGRRGQPGSEPLPGAAAAGAAAAGACERDMQSITSRRALSQTQLLALALMLPV